MKHWALRGIIYGGNIKKVSQGERVMILISNDLHAKQIHIDDDNFEIKAVQIKQRKEI